MEFADSRPYTRGDDIRRIDWNLYARLDRLFLRLFVAEEEVTLHLLLDGTASMDWGEPNKWWYARRVAAAFGYIALTNLDRVTVTVFGADTPRTMPAVRGKGGTIPLLRFLQQLPAGRAAGLREVCRRFAQTEVRGGPLLICSDLLDPNWQEALRALCRRPFEITLVHLLAPQEIEPALEGDLRLVDAESGAAVEVTADAATLARYTEAVRSWCVEVESFCASRGIHYVFVDTSVPFEELVLSILRRRGVLR